MVPSHFLWTKANANGMALGTPGRVAISGVFHNCRGFSKGAFCKYVGIHTAFNYELLVFIQAINIVWDKGWHRIWVEMESQFMVNCALDKNFVLPWFCANRWYNCKFKIDIMHLLISDKIREGCNMLVMAHFLLTVAFTKVSWLIWGFKCCIKYLFFCFLFHSSVSATFSWVCLVFFSFFSFFYMYLTSELSFIHV